MDSFLSSKELVFSRLWFYGDVGCCQIHQTIVLEWTWEFDQFVKFSFFWREFWGWWWFRWFLRLGAVEKLGFWELLQEELLESFHWFLWTGFFAYSSSKSHVFDNFCWKVSCSLDIVLHHRLWIATLVQNPNPTMGEQETPAATNPKMQVMLGVSHSIQGYPKPSISSRNALNWILTKLVRQSCKKEYKILILHVQVPDQDGTHAPHSLCQLFLKTPTHPPSQYDIHCEEIYLFVP